MREAPWVDWSCGRTPSFSGGRRGGSGRGLALTIILALQTLLSPPTPPPKDMPGPFYARYVPPKAAAASSPTTPRKAPEPSPPSPELAPTPVSEKKEKRTKKRKRTEVQDAAVEEDEDAALKKHKSVLSKFEKSTKIAERLKAREPSAEDEDPREEPELHGKSSTYEHA